jgi:hypothetical protein
VPLLVCVECLVRCDVLSSWLAASSAFDRTSQAGKAPQAVVTPFMDPRVIGHGTQHERPPSRSFF